jgi:hypothetical protein
MCEAVSEEKIGQLHERQGRQEVVSKYIQNFGSGLVWS